MNIHWEIHFRFEKISYPQTEGGVTPDGLHIVRQPYPNHRHESLREAQHVL